MDSFDEQPGKLKLLNSSPLSPPLQGVSATHAGDSVDLHGGKVAELSSNFQKSVYIPIPKDAHADIVDNGTSNQISPNGISTKKVGPIVPPKPNKPIKLPEVPQSMLVKQVCEPLYSKRLQSNGSRDNSTSGVPRNCNNPKLNSAFSSHIPTMFRKQPINSSHNRLYGKTNKVSLDNPAILEQQLEALAYHKMQLEKKGLLHQKTPTASVNVGSNCYNPKLLTACIPKKVANNVGPNSGVFATDSPNIVYSNFCSMTRSLAPVDVAANMESFNVYSNMMSDQQGYEYGSTAADNLYKAGRIYHNEINEHDASLGDLPPLLKVLSMATSESVDCIRNQNDDDIPLPPSPVSSSYSELRRATDIYPKMPLNVPLHSKQYHGTNLRSIAGTQVGTMHYPQFIEKCSDGKFVPGDPASGGQQTYMNMNYNIDYVGYNDSPSSQSISQGSSDYYGYGSFSQGSSTYESIYEPINPRPPSHLSSRSNYLMLVQYANCPQSSDGVVGSSGSLSVNSVGLARNKNILSGGGKLAKSGCNLGDKHLNPKETEVEALTDFLVHSMDVGNDGDSYGVCVKCNEGVVGENSGCTAMDQIYHILCFTCSQCQINLQGKPFYVLEGKPYCEFDYLETLEKCSVCMKPILERILRATGKPYHPQCFTCVVCGNSLDGIPFTVDATNQNYCIADFHNKFAPRCCVCMQPIMPESGQEETVRVVALDRSFHFECYKCEDCGLLLSSEADGRGCYPLDDHVLCKSCNAERVQMLTNRMTTEL